MIAQQTDSITLLFAGDIMMHDRQLHAAQNDSTYDFHSSFKYIKPLIASADIAIGNLELTFPGKPPYQGFPYFKSPDTLATALRNCGFDVLLTANNHSNDDNARGLIHTIDVLEQNNFLQTGTFKNKQERDLHYPLIVYRNGFKIALLNFTFSTNKRKTIAPTIVNRIDYEEIQADIKEAEALEADFIIVNVHWGREYELSNNKEQQRLSQKFFNWGADLIVGSHPHVVQPIRYVDYVSSKRKKEKGLVVFSLGNFISGQTTLDTDGGILFELKLTKSADDNKAFIDDFSFIPIFRYIEKSDNRERYYTIPVHLAETNRLDINMRSSQRKAMNIFASRVRKRLKNGVIREQEFY